MITSTSSRLYWLYRFSYLFIYVYFGTDSTERFALNETNHTSLPIAVDGVSTLDSSASGRFGAGKNWWYFDLCFFQIIDIDMRFNS